MKTYKLEEKVTIVSNGSDHEFKIGEIVTIKDVRVGKNKYKYYRAENENGNSWHIDHTDL